MASLSGRQSRHLPPRGAVRRLASATGRAGPGGAHVEKRQSGPGLDEAVSLRRGRTRRSRPVGHSSGRVGGWPARCRASRAEIPAAQGGPGRSGRKRKRPKETPPEPTRPTGRLGRAGEAHPAASDNSFPCVRCTPARCIPSLLQSRGAGPAGPWALMDGGAAREGRQPLCGVTRLPRPARPPNPSAASSYILHTLGSGRPKQF